MLIHVAPVFLIVLLLQVVLVASVVVVTCRGGVVGGHVLVGDLFTWCGQRGTRVLGVQGGVRVATHALFLGARLSFIAILPLRLLILLLRYLFVIFIVINTINSIIFNLHPYLSWLRVATRYLTCLLHSLLHTWLHACLNAIVPCHILTTCFYYIHCHDNNFIQTLLAPTNTITTLTINNINLLNIHATSHPNRHTNLSFLGHLNTTTLKLLPITISTTLILLLCTIIKSVTNNSYPNQSIARPLHAYATIFITYPVYFLLLLHFNINTVSTI